MTEAASNEASSDLVVRAQAFAKQVHADQVDKAGRPYVEHLARVAKRVTERGGDARHIATAWLHDSIEDVSVTEAQIAELCGTDVASAVVAITRTGEGNYYEQVKANPIALFVKFADIDDNADPERLAKLDPETAERLRNKYANARAALAD